MPRVKSLKPYTWNDRPMPAHREHDATENEARLLSALGWAEAAPAARATYQTTNMVAAPVAPAVPRGTPNRAQRRQQTLRRDMTAPD